MVVVRFAGMSKKLPSLSIFFPAYYDENTVEPLTRACVETAKKLTDNYEILIIDDCSPDKTGEIADRLSSEFKEVRVIHHPKNKGVGEAMITGYTESKKDYVFYTDGDAQYDVRELPFLAEHASSFDLVIGYRLHRAEGFKRIFTSRCFHLLVQVFFGIHFRDIDCSFKLIHRNVLKKIKFYTRGGLIDAEMMIQAKKLKVPVKEVGVHHYPRRFGHSRCLRMGLVLTMLKDVVRLRMKLWGLG
jgi:glycosyltransferase involved in cell wall biosynthesis